MRFFLTFLLVFALGGCTDPTFAPVFQNAGGIGDDETIFVVTNRARGPDGYFGGHRSAAYDYLDVTVSVPRDRDLGSIPISYRRPKPGKHFVMTESRDLQGRGGFRRSLRRAVAALPHQDREITVYVHGYNNSFSDGVFRTAQLMHDFDLHGLAVHYSWPSIAHPLGYAHDRDSLLFARDGLEQMLRDVGQSGARSVTLVGHSLGAMLVMETLRQMDIRDPGLSDRVLDGVVLLSPDIDLDLFRSQAHRIRSLPQPFAIFVSQKDRALRLSSEVNGRSQRLGTLAHPDAVADLDVFVLDVTAFSGEGVYTHFVPGSSPSLIKLLARSADLTRSFSGAPAARSPLPGVALTVQNATQIILSPGLILR